MKSIFEQLGGTYHEENGYLIPDLTLPTEEEKPIGIWGQRHLRYIKEHKQLFYFNLLTSGKLNNYLADVNEQAKKLFFRLVKQLTENESITKQLKANNSIERITLMNNIRNKASETVNHDIIYI